MSDRSRLKSALFRTADLIVNILCTLAYIIAAYLVLGLSLKFVS